MKKLYVLLLIGAVGIFACSAVKAFEGTVDESTGVQEQGGMTYVCEKDDYSQSEPGKCPTCGLDLVPVKVDTATTVETPQVPTQGDVTVPPLGDESAAPSVGDTSPAPEDVDVPDRVTE